MRFFYLITTLFMPLSLAAQLDWIPDYTGATQYRIPAGWTVQTSQQNGVYAWQANRDAGQEGSPSLFVLAMPDFPGSQPDILLQLLGSEFQSLQTEKRQDVSPNEAHFRLTGSKNDIEARFTAIFLRDPAQNMLFISGFVAPVSDYHSLGADEVLYTALQRPNIFASNPWQLPSDITELTETEETPADSHPSLDKNQLTGSWMQAFSYSTGEAYQQPVSGEILYGSRGYGHLLEIRPDGTYRLTYRYDNVYAGCTNHVEMVETGKYRISGEELVLTNRRYNGLFNVCGQITREDQSNQPEKRLVARISKDNTLHLKGTPFEYSISTETDLNGQPYFQEDLERIK